MPRNRVYRRCVAMAWPALVVGHRGCGKSRIIHGLAAGVGARLTEVSMTPSVDVTELLGCFEQVLAPIVRVMGRFLCARS